MYIDVYLLYCSPKQLELTAVGESVVMDNIEVFRMNGFHFHVDPTGQETYACICHVHYGLKYMWGVYNNNDIHQESC